MRRYTDLVVWQRAHALTLVVYEVTRDFPSDEKYGLVSQLRRACVSIEANLAEGSSRRTEVDFARFVNMSEGSASEVEVLMRIAVDVGQTRDERNVAGLIGEVIKMLRSLHKSLKVSS